MKKYLCLLLAGCCLFLASCETPPTQPPSEPVPPTVTEPRELPTTAFEAIEYLNTLEEPERSQWNSIKESSDLFINILEPEKGYIIVSAYSGALYLVDMNNDTIKRLDVEDSERYNPHYISYYEGEIYFDSICAYSIGLEGDFPHSVIYNIQLETIQKKYRALNEWVGHISVGRGPNVEGSVSSCEIIDDTLVINYDIDKEKYYKIYPDSEYHDLYPYMYFYNDEFSLKSTLYFQGITDPDQKLKKGLEALPGIKNVTSVTKAKNINGKGTMQDGTLLTFTVDEGRLFYGKTAQNLTTEKNENGYPIYGDKYPVFWTEKK